MHPTYASSIAVLLAVALVWLCAVAVPGTLQAECQLVKSGQQCFKSVHRASLTSIVYLEESQSILIQALNSLRNKATPAGMTASDTARAEDKHFLTHPRQQCGPQCLKGSELQCLNGLWNPSSRQAPTPLLVARTPSPFTSLQTCKATSTQAIPRASQPRQNQALPQDSNTRKPSHITTSLYLISPFKPTCFAPPTLALHATPNAAWQIATSNSSAKDGMQVKLPQAVTLVPPLPGLLDYIKQRVNDVKQHSDWWLCMSACVLVGMALEKMCSHIRQSKANSTTPQGDNQQQKLDSALQALAESQEVRAALQADKVKLIAQVEAGDKMTLDLEQRCNKAEQDNNKYSTEICPSYKSKLYQAANTIEALNTLADDNKAKLAKLTTDGEQKDSVIKHFQGRAEDFKQLAAMEKHVSDVNSKMAGKDEAITVLTKACNKKDDEIKKLQHALECLQREPTPATSNGRPPLPCDAAMFKSLASGYTPSNTNYRRH